MLLTIASALSILLATLPLLLLLPHIYVTIVLIVFVKTLLIFSVMDYSLSVWEARPLTNLATECKKLYIDIAEPVKGLYVSVHPGSLAVFNEFVVYVLTFPGLT